ncbi:MAG: aminotransferase class V-fold PLP-dependent enzyme [Granulosicoccus sp.]
MLDIKAIRAETPACQHTLHFNNAGASLMPQPVYEAVIRHLSLENEVGGYEAESRASADLQAFYTEFAQLLNASASEIAYVENATRAWDMAFYGLPLQAGDRILTHESEYSSNYLGMLQQAKRKNLHIDLIPSDEFGQIDVKSIPDLIQNQTRLVAITHVPSQGGLVNPAEEVGKIAKQHGLIYLLDACQSAGQLEVDVKRLQCDILSGTGRKFLRGPRGTGFLYVNSDFLEQIDPPFVDLLSTDWTEDNVYSLVPGAKRFENWESYVAGRVGLMQAVRYANALGLHNIEARVNQLATQLRSALSEIEGVEIHDQGIKKCALVTFTKNKIDPSVIAQRLLSKNINISTTALTHARLDLGRRQLNSLARASVHYFNTDDEIDRFVEAVKAL